LYALSHSELVALDRIVLITDRLAVLVGCWFVVALCSSVRYKRIAALVG
jgi:hypothetical protein